MLMQHFVHQIAWKVAKIFHRSPDRKILRKPAQMGSPCLHRPSVTVNPLNAELNPISHLLALLGVHPIFHISKVRVKLLVDFNLMYDLF